MSNSHTIFRFALCSLMLAGACSNSETPKKPSAVTKEHPAKRDAGNGSTADEAGSGAQAATGGTGGQRAEQPRAGSGGAGGRGGFPAGGGGGHGPRTPP